MGRLDLFIYLEFYFITLLPPMHLTPFGIFLAAGLRNSSRNKVRYFNASLSLGSSWKYGIYASIADSNPSAGLSRFLFAGMSSFIRIPRAFDISPMRMRDRAR